MTEQQQTGRPPQILVAVLQMGSVRWELASWLAWIVANENRYPFAIRGFGGDHAAVPVSSNRNRIMRETPRDFDGVLMLDADTVPHPRTMDIPLLGKDVVLAPTPIWHPEDELGPIVTNLVPLGSSGGNMDSATLPIGAPEIRQIKEGGSGCIYISRKVLDDPRMRGAFRFIPDEDGITEVGEDHAFCRQAIACGYEVWGALAYPMGHIKEINLSTVFDLFHPVAGRSLALVVTGTGRCGTGFASNLFSNAGIKTGHEAIFMYRGLEAAEKRLARFASVQADSSWMAAPYLDKPLCGNATVVQMTRHPKKVLASWVRKEPRGTPRYWEFCLEHLPVLAEIEDDPTMYAARYVLWNELIERKLAGRAYYKWRVEDGPSGELGVIKWLMDLGRLPQDALNRPLYPDRSVNSKPGEPQEIGLEQIQEPWRSRIQAMADRYGYKDWS